MDMRGHHMEAPHHEMTSEVPMPSSHPSSSGFLQQHTSSTGVGLAEGSTGSVPSLLPSVTKVKIITSSTSTGSIHGNNGTTTPTPTTAVGAAAGSYRDNRKSPTSPTIAGPNYGNNGLTLSSEGPGEVGACTAPDLTNSGKTGGTSATLSRSPTTATQTDDLRIPSSLELRTSRRPVKYRECLKNHAASLGGHANDGCGEFMPSGEEGTIEALKCAACNCHRNFHRREVEGESYAGNCECRYGARERKRMIEPLFPAPLPLPPPPGLHMHPRTMLPSSQMIMAFNSHDSDEYEGVLFSQSSLKKRFRTKFTAEQKERMGAFAEKLGWRIQKHDEAAVQEFCAEVGVKRHVLKVWMHNNKHALGKKLTLPQGCITMGEEEEIRS